jgi:hypothetical protein
MTAFEQYLAALDVLGVAPGTPIKKVRQKFRVMMRGVHPDLHPGDAGKEAAAKALTDAMTTLDAMSRDGRMQAFFMMAERMRRTGDSDSIRALSPPPLLLVRVVMAVAGAGKTLGWVRSVAQARESGQRLHLILSSASIGLVDQTARALAKHGVQAPVVRVVHSEAEQGRVAAAMRAYFQATAAGQDAVLLSTHRATAETPLPPDPESWNLTFDEMPDFVTFLSIDAPTTHVHLSRYVSVERLDDQLYHLKPTEDISTLERLTRIALNRPHDGGLEHLQDLARVLIHGHTVLVPIAQWDELLQSSQRDKHAGHLDVLVIVPPTWFQRYDSVTMMGARCTSHFTALVWTRIRGVQFCEDSRLNLPRTHTRQQAGRLTIRWLFEERATRAFLSRRAINGGTLFLGACSAVARYYAGRAYLWSAPQPGDDKEHGVADNFWRKLELEPTDAFDPNLRLPGRAHGLNRERFLETCNVALLQVINLTPEQYRLLYQLGLTDEEIDQALAFDVAYQDMARCNIRVIDSTRDVDVTVLDQRTALELADKFPGCRVARYAVDLLPCGLARSNRRGPASSGAAMTSTQRSRAYRARHAALRAQRQDAKRES